MYFVCIASFISWVRIEHLILNKQIMCLYFNTESLFVRYIKGTYYEFSYAD